MIRGFFHKFNRSFKNLQNVIFYVKLLSPTLSCIANLNQRDMAKQLLTPLRLLGTHEFSLKNYSCELFNLTGTVGKVELISTFTTVVCESWNVRDKYTWHNAGDLKQLSMDQTLGEDNRSD